MKVAYEGCRKTFCEDLGKPRYHAGEWKAPRLEGKLAWLVNNQAFAAFPSMAIGQEHFAAILFVIALMGIALVVLVVLLCSVISTDIRLRHPDVSCSRIGNSLRESD